MQNVVIRLKGPRSVRSQPSGRLEWSTLELMHNWTSPTTIKRRRPHHTCKRHVLIPEKVNMLKMTKFMSWVPCWTIDSSRQWKKAICFTLLRRRLEALPRLTVQLQFKNWKRWGQAHSGKLFNHDDRHGENEKRPTVPLLLKRITRLKIVNSEIKSEDRNSYLERYSPKGSCHLDESSMSHTLAQNCHCEFCCGVHLTCKNNPTTPDRSRSMKGPEKQWQLPSP